jgi:hypothetical protein
MLVSWEKSRGWLGMSIIGVTLCVLPSWLYMVFVGLVCFQLAGYIWKRFYIRYTGKIKHSQLDFHEMASKIGRIAVHGHPYELQQLKQINLNGFEPFVCRLVTGSRDRLLLSPVSSVLGIKDVAALVTICVLWSAGVPILPLLCISIGIFYGVPWLHQAKRIKYIRLAPQLLDVLVFSPWSASAERGESLDLHLASICCRFDKGEVQITPKEDSRETFVVDLTGLCRPHEFVEMLFRASLSEHSAPPLPTNELVG